VLGAGGAEGSDVAATAWVYERDVVVDIVDIDVIDAIVVGGV